LLDRNHVNSRSPQPISFLSSSDGSK
jgi:hypothetical protein